MRPLPITDPAEIAHMLSRNPALHAYELGDLDPFFWPDTEWYTDTQRRVVALVYAKSTVMLYAEPADHAVAASFLTHLQHLLPQRFLGHFSVGLDDVITSHQRAGSYGRQWKMALFPRRQQVDRGSPAVVRLTISDVPEMLGLYQQSYQGNWFDPRMVATGRYFGLRIDNRLVTVGGVHVYSEQQRIAVIGNVATHPAHRGRGLARLVCGRLCHELAQSVDVIALDVAADNHAAVVCYQRLGFAVVGEYEKASFEKRRTGSTP